VHRLRGVTPPKAAKIKPLRPGHGFAPLCQGGDRRPRRSANLSLRDKAMRLAKGIRVKAICSNRMFRKVHRPPGEGAGVTARRGRGKKSRGYSDQTAGPDGVLWARPDQDEVTDFTQGPAERSL
jgi:hypothetical protein